MRLFRILKKIPISRYVNFLIIAVIIYSAFNTKYWKQKVIIEYDVKIYYSYLPLTFIYKNTLTCKNFNYLPKEFTDNLWPTKTNKGLYVMKTSMGMAILYAPFFFIAHALAKPLGYMADGLSVPYQFAIAMGCIIYLSIGLYFLRRVLERFFSQWTIAVTLFSIVLCTNITNYAIRESGMTHVYSFTLFSVFLFLVLKWYEKPNVINSIFIGLIGGLITLIRPNNIVIFLIFFLFGCLTFKDIRNRLLFLVRSYKKLLLILVAAFLVWLPQFLYWKITSGQFLFYSYSGEHFFFNNPHIISGLFGFRKGWLLYYPIMIFAIAGIFFLRENIRKYKLSIIIFLILNIYIVLSWWCWWYGGG